MIRKLVLTSALVMVLPFSAAPADKPLGWGELRKLESPNTLLVEVTAYSERCVTGPCAISREKPRPPAKGQLGTIATDPRYIKPGTILYIEGWGLGIAEDTGGAIKGYKIDVFIPDYEKALKWGRKKMLVEIIEEGTTR